MNPIVDTKTISPITEVNIKALKNISAYVENLNQNNKEISINTHYASFIEISHTIESMLNMVIECTENDTVQLDKFDCSNVLIVAKNLLQQLPIEFVDTLLIKESHNTENFKNLKSL